MIPTYQIREPFYSQFFAFLKKDRGLYPLPGLKDVKSSYTGVWNGIPGKDTKPSSDTRVLLASASEMHISTQHSSPKTVLSISVGDILCQYKVLLFGICTVLHRLLASWQFCLISSLPAVYVSFCVS